MVYLDDIAIYDIDSNYSITSVCPSCEVAPTVSIDSSVYKINVNGSASLEGYNNYLLYYKGDTSVIDISSTFGHNNGIDLYLWSGLFNSHTSLNNMCFPGDVINKYISWGNEETHQIYLKDLNPSNSYTIRVLSATSNTGSNRGLKMWTTGENMDTVFAANNSCSMAELANLGSDKNGDLAINVAPIGGAAYINAIEIVEIAENSSISINKTELNELSIYPNPVNDKLFIKGERIPSNVSIYTYDGVKLKYAKNTNAINISDLKKGIYLVVIYIDGAFVARKMIKK